jgi:hypothetical protein
MEEVPDSLVRTPCKPVDVKVSKVSSVLNLQQLRYRYLRPLYDKIKRYPLFAEFLIGARDMEFRDLSAVGSILRAHSLLSVVPAASLYWPEARAALQDVLAILLAFTQPSLQPNKVTVLASEVICSGSGFISSGSSILG